MLESLYLHCCSPCTLNYVTSCLVNSPQLETLTFGAVMHHSTRSRQVFEMRDERSLDRISSLPDELLVYILSFLSIFDAVKTCVLSRRWRLLFTLTSILSFDDIEYFGRWGSLTASQIEDLKRRWVLLFTLTSIPSFDDVEYFGRGGSLTASQIEDLKMSFHRFIDRVLAVHTISPFQKFSLVLGCACYDSSHLCAWITAALKKSVRHLHVSTFLLPNALPNCMFGSQTLVSLDISTPIDYIFNVPDIVCLPSLKTLKLYRITFLDGDSVRRFFIGCSQLKELVLHFCRLGTDPVCVSAKALQSLMIIFCTGHAEIDAPNLEDITYIFTSCTLKVVVKNSSSLSSVKLGFVSYELSDPTQAICELITSAYNARELSLMENSLKLLARDQPKQIPTYSNLKSLRLGHCCLDSWKYLPFLLANSAQLETVVFEAGLFPYHRYDQEYEWDPNKALAPFSSNVKYIEVHSYGGYTLELLLLKYLLENAGVLMRLVLYTRSFMPLPVELEVSKQLLMLPRASTYCTIELKTPENVDMLYFLPWTPIDVELNLLPRINNLPNELLHCSLKYFIVPLLIFAFAADLVW